MENGTISLLDAAQMLFDKYEQDYATRDSFFELEDFARSIIVKYSLVLEQLYQEARKNNKIDTGYNNVEISPAWCISEDQDVQKDDDSEYFYIDLKQPIFAFNYDAFTNMLQSVHSRSVECRKISTQEIKNLDIIPPMNVSYFWVEGVKRVRFANKDPKKVNVKYVPALSIDNDDNFLSQSILGMIQDDVIKGFREARDGVTINEANDGNKNAVLGQQVNPALNKVQQG